MNKLVFILTLSFFAGYFIAAHGRENEWSFIKRILMSTLTGIIIGLASQLITL